MKATYRPYTGPGDIDVPAPPPPRGRYGRSTCSETCVTYLASGCNYVVSARGGSSAQATPAATDYVLVRCRERRLGWCVMRCGTSSASGKRMADWREVFYAVPEPPRALTEQELRQAFRLGVLPALLSRDVCHKRSNGCNCSVCAQVGVSIAENGFTPDGLVAGPPEKRQPWDVRPVRRAA